MLFQALSRTSRYTLWLAGLAIVVAAFGQPAQAITLREAVQLAVANHPVVAASENRSLSAAQEVRIQRAGLYPRVDVTASAALIHTDSPTTRLLIPGVDPANGDPIDTAEFGAQVSLRQLLFDGGQRFALIDAAEATALAEEFGVESVQDEIALQAVQAYLSVVRGRIVLQAAIDHIEALRAIQEKVRQRTSLGIDTGGDLAQVIGQLAEADAQRAQIIADLRTAEAQFAQIVGQEPDTLSMPDEISGPSLASVAAATERARDNNPVLARAGENTNSLRAQEVAARRVFWPQFDLEFSASTTDNEKDVDRTVNDVRGRVVGSLNLFAGGGQRARVRQASYQTAESERNYASLDRRLTERIRANFNIIRASSERIPLLVEEIEALRQVIIVFERQFDLGERGLLNVLEQRGELFRTQSALAQDRALVRVARYAVLADTGEILAVFNAGQ